VASDSTLGYLYSRATTQRKVAVYTAILVALPVVYTFQTTTGPTRTDGLPVLSILLVVGVPEACGKYWPQYERTRETVGWTLTACVFVSLEFAGLYTVLTGYRIQPTIASIGAAVSLSMVNIFWSLDRFRRPKAS
jgi:asparagine N-glycosylation enzyme membrane subunit Stt3